MTRCIYSAIKSCHPWPAPLSPNTKYRRWHINEGWDDIASRTHEAGKLRWRRLVRLTSQARRTLISLSVRLLGPLYSPPPPFGTAELLLRPVDVPHANAVSATGNTTTRCTRAGISPRAYTPVVAAFKQLTHRITRSHTLYRDFS